MPRPAQIKDVSMAFSARDVYLETQIRTATPQKLRLMLIEGALRFAHQAIACWDREEQRGLRCNALARCHDILTELFGSIRADGSPVATNVKAIYRFLFRHLAAATATNDCDKMRDVVRVLEQERETWRQVCEKMPEPPLAPDDALSAGREITARDCPTFGLPASAPFSLEA
jgi:flagellar secretion chaperone FliS